jgi:hypothetical protein
MRRSVSLAVLFALFAAFPLNTVRADIKVAGALWLDQNEWQSMQESMPPEERAKLAQGGFLFRYGGAHMSICQSGKKMRVDTPDYAILFDDASQQTTLIDYDKRLAIVAKSHPLVDSKSLLTSVKRTGQTMKIHGLIAHRYLISVKDSHLDIEAEDWVAENMPYDNLIGASSNPLIQGIWGHIKGLPMWCTVVIAHGDRSLTINYEVESISTKTLPADTFAAPAGFRKLTVPDNAPDGTEGDTSNGIAYLDDDRSSWPAAFSPFTDFLEGSLISAAALKELATAKPAPSNEIARKPATKELLTA